MKSLLPMPGSAMRGTVFFSGRVLLEWDPVDVLFIVQVSIVVTWMVRTKIKLKFTIPSGFTTDLGSGLTQVARHLRADLAHDWLYANHEGLNKGDADRLWLDAMRADDTSWWRRRVRYLAVTVSLTARRRWNETSKESSDEDTSDNW